MQSVEATQQQLADFGKALEMAAIAAGYPSAGALAQAVGSGEEAVRLWYRGKREPNRSTVFRLEKLCNRRPGALSRILGYLPPDAKPARTLAEALEADGRLTPEARQVLLAAYEAAVAGGRRG